MAKHAPSAPRWITPVTKAEIERGDGRDFAEFVGEYCRITKDSVGGSAGDLLRLRPWQADVVSRLLARTRTGRLKHRQGLIGVARKNAKSTLGAALALFELIYGPQGGEVYSIAAEKEQARIVFGTARRMVEMDPTLSARLQLYRDVISDRDSGSIYRVLSAESYSKEGLNPHFVIADEVHAQPTRELWDVMSLASGARLEPLMVGITTAGVRSDSSGRDSLCYGMYQYGKRVAAKEIKDPAFFMAWWEPKDPESDHRLPSTWAEANPGLGDLVAEADFASAVLRTPEPEFRTKRANQWVSTVSTWLPFGSWAACTESRGVEPYAEVILGFDGSFSNDSTALVAVEVPSANEDLAANPTLMKMMMESGNWPPAGSRVPHLDVVACWEKPAVMDDGWRVPIADVEDAIRQACRQYKVREIVCDPFRWARTYQALEAEGLPIVEFPQSPQRMVPATARFYEAVLNGGLTHSGDPRLARHMDNCTLKVDSRGARLMKDARNSPRKIDLAVAAVMAFDRASSPGPEALEPFSFYAD